MSARRQAQLVRVVAVVIGLVLVAAGIAAVVAGQKASERRAYAEATAGPPCQAAASQPAFVSTAALKTIAVGPATFRFLRGDADCTVLKPGLMGDDAERPVCRFDHPGYVAVEGHPGGFVIASGQASLALEPHGARCTLQPSL